MGLHPGTPPVFFPQSGKKYRKSGQTYKHHREWDKKRMGEKEFYYKSVPKQTVNTATILSAGRVVVLYRALCSTYIIVSKIPLEHRKCDKEGNGEDSVRCLEELEAMHFRHSCHSPFEKCIKAIVKLVGLGMGTQSRDHHPNLSGGDWKRAAAYSGGFEMLYCAT